MAEGTQGQTLEDAGITRRPDAGEELDALVRAIEALTGVPYPDDPQARKSYNEALLHWTPKTHTPTKDAEGAWCCAAHDPKALHADRGLGHSEPCEELRRASRPEDFDADYQVNSGSGRFS